MPRVLRINLQQHQQNVNASRIVFCKLVVYAQETGVLFPCFSVATFFWSMRLYFKTAYYKLLRDQEDAENSLLILKSK